MMRITSSGIGMFLLFTVSRGRNGAIGFMTPAAVIRRNVVRGKVTMKAGKKGGGGGGGGTKKEKNAYAKTILLPQTPFSQRANAIVREPELQQFWKSHNLYQKLSDAAATSSNEKFVLHDGPPYANGDLHIGHALNKILKDFINRKEILKGKQVSYVPGWDCHGLPIELKVLQAMKSKERRALTPVTLREKATQFALDTVQKQSDSFERYGILGDFEHPYLTLDKAFEANQIRVFGEMYTKGYIFRGRKPVHWSPSSKTALAEAELEYPEGHVSKSIYVAMEVEKCSEKLEEFGDGLKVAIWTTTPWTIPANMAVSVNEDLKYSVVESEGVGRLIVATDLIETLAGTLNLPEDQPFKTLTTLSGTDLLGTTYKHPLYPDRIPPILSGGDYITTESGTGLVHTAPGHGLEDFATGLKAGLDIFSPVDDLGKFTSEAGERFAGLKVLDEGNQEIIDALNETKSLLKMENYGHKYPYDWRTKKPTIFRATDQWFASVEGFRDQALEAVEKVKWVPSIGQNRITSFIATRGDWCISRQRSWGVPIPVFYNKQDPKQILLDKHTLQHIQSVIAKHGTDAWYTMDEVDLLPSQYKDQADQWTKGTDTMDVWFDSGSSWAGVTQHRPELRYPADLYLEGSDQHRGWFQSSLLTSVAANDVAPFKTVLTHGFVLDEKGYKMSKSMGNVVNPMEVIEGGNNKKTNPAYGADVLRLWVASVDYTGDVCIGEGIIKQTFESYRKLRNTARYLIGNLADFDPKDEQQAVVPYEELPSMDKWMLGRLSAVLKEADEATDEYQFNRATQELLRFATADLSNFYLDVAKDRLYISSINDKRRRSCQTVLRACLEGFAKAIAPILPHMAEDIWQNLPYDKSTESVFEGGWPKHLMSYEDFDGEKWALVRDLRDDVNKMMELARNDKLIGASLDAATYVYAKDESVREVLKGLESDLSLLSEPVKTNGVDDLRSALMLSQVNVVDSPEEVTSACDEKYTSEGANSGILVGVKKAVGTKCARCWFYDDQVGKLGLPFADLCQRCNDAVFMWEKETGETFVIEEKKEEEQQQTVP